jgi:hypothetical protein
VDAAKIAALRVSGASWRMISRWPCHAVPGHLRSTVKACRPQLAMGAMR